MRTRFDQQLGKLNVELITMGALCEEAIGLVAAALTRGGSDGLFYRPAGDELM